MKKLHLILTFLLCAFLSACQQQQNESGAVPGSSTENKPASTGTIVAVGDSLTAGYGIPESEAYPAQLERKLRENGYHWNVANAGISGETSSGALARLDWILKLDPDIVILETGANDGLRGQDPELTRRNIERMATTLKSKGVVVVLAGMQMLTNLGPTYTRKYAAIYPQVAKEHNLILVPFFLENVAGEDALNISDGIHPNAKGYAIVTENLYPYVLEAIKAANGE